VKVLIDGCVAASVAVGLTAAKHDVESVADWSNDPGDAEILAHAARLGQVLVTIDKDFGELAIVRGYPHRGILRLAGFSALRHSRGGLEPL
jgi:predicted nuclease of predicted toxin-antitoxin system